MAVSIASISSMFRCGYRIVVTFPSQPLSPSVSRPLFLQRDLGNTTTPPHPTHGIAPLSLNATAEKRIVSLGIKAPRRFSPSIAQKAISASSFGHRQIQPRAKNDTRLQPRGGVTNTNEPQNTPKSHKPLGIIQNSRRSWMVGSISLTQIHTPQPPQNPLLHPTRNPISAQNPTTRLRLASCLLKVRSLDGWDRQRRSYQMSRQRASAPAWRRDISTHPHIHPHQKPSLEVERDTHDAQRKKGGHSPAGHPPLQDVSLADGAGHVS